MLDCQSREYIVLNEVACSRLYNNRTNIRVEKLFQRQIQYVTQVVAKYGDEVWCQSKKAEKIHL